MGDARTREEVVGGGEEMISERALRKWRKEALLPSTKEMYEGTAPALTSAYEECKRRILLLTQECMDERLKGGKS